MKKKLLIALPVLLVGLGGVYKFVLAKPAPAPKPKVDGEVYVLPRDFLINLSDGQFVKLDVAVEIGRTTMTLGDALGLGPGSVVGLHRMAGEPVDLLVNGRVIARGEVVVIDEEFGLRVTDVATARGAAREEPEAPVAEAA